jgi:L-fucose isomerase-like protein
MAVVDLAAEQKRFEAQLARIKPSLPDIEFVDCGLVTLETDLAPVKEKLRGTDGILFLQMTMGCGKVLAELTALNLPLVVFAEPFSGHEWHTIAAMQREGKRIECWASSKFEDIPIALRPIRAIRRLKDTKVLHVSNRDADAAYVKLMKEKFGTEIKSFQLPELEAAYKAVSEADVRADAETWLRCAAKRVEPTEEDVLKASRMALAMMNMMKAEGAVAITMNCLGVGLIDRGMGYPCLGFSRFNSMGLGGICEADMKSTMTHMIFNYLVDRPGFVTDPCFDYSDNTIIHAHCVSALKMEGPNGPTHPYLLRSHLEDNRGVVLQVKLPINRPVSMARLIGDNIMLFSTGQAVASPLVDRGCRTKVTARVEHPEKFLETWSSGLHRVVFYGDHTRDIERFCRLMNIRLVREGTDDVRNVPGLGWLPHIHA